jgi:hypothetical protein
MLWISNSDLILELYFPSVSKRWKIQYFYDHRGISPFQEWFNFELDEEQKAFLLQVISKKLIKQGPSLIHTKWLSSIHKDLYQLRVLKNFKAGRQKILLRVYLCFNEDSEVVLLCGYDKGKNSSPEFQQKEIEKALDYLNQWREENYEL